MPNFLFLFLFLFLPKMASDTWERHCTSGEKCPLLLLIIVTFSDHFSHFHLHIYIDLPGESLTCCSFGFSVMCGLFPPLLTLSEPGLCIQATQPSKIHRWQKLLHCFTIPSVQPLTHRFSCQPLQCPCKALTTYCAPQPQGAYENLRVPFIQYRKEVQFKTVEHYFFFL